MDMKKETVEKLKILLAWTAQQGYYQGEEIAQFFGEFIGGEMFLDQACYNSYKWRKKEVANAGHK